MDRLPRLPARIRTATTRIVWGAVLVGVLLGAGQLWLQAVDTPGDGGGSGVVVPDPPARTVNVSWDGERDPDDPGRSRGTVAGVTYDSVAIERAIHRRINTIRRDNGLDPLVYSNYTASVARAHSEDMAERGFRAHDNPDGESPSDRFRNVRERCGGYGENYVYGTVIPAGYGEFEEPVSSNADVAREMVEWWMNSPAHRRNLLRGTWSAAGVGVHIENWDGRNGVIVFGTQNFCATPSG